LLIFVAYAVPDLGAVAPQMGASLGHPCSSEADGDLRW
jgi:hypothetical protein